MDACDFYSERFDVAEVKVDLRSLSELKFDSVSLLEKKMDFKKPPQRRKLN